MKKNDLKTIMRILVIYILFSVGIVGLFGVPFDDLAWFEWICVFLLSKLISATLEMKSWAAVGFCFSSS